jgi:uncharacterized protein YjeT (DUF2065 family)
MRIFLYAFSFLWIVSGSCFIIYTRQSRAFVGQLFEEIERRILAVVAAVVGFALLLSSPYSVHGWFIILLGLLSLLKGVFLFVNPADLVTQMRKWYAECASDQTYRFLGIVMVVLGTALFSWII